MAPAARVSCGLRCAAPKLSARLAEAPLRHVQRQGFGKPARRALGMHDALEGFNAEPDKGSRPAQRRHSRESPENGRLHQPAGLQ